MKGMDRDGEVKDEGNLGGRFVNRTLQTKQHLVAKNLNRTKRCRCEVEAVYGFVV